MSDYIKITWPEVRAGDVLMHENGDRLTVQGFERVQIRTTAGLYAPSEYRGSGFTPRRKVSPLPTKPGAYHDRDGDYWLLDRNGTWYDWSSLREPNPRGGRPDAYAPLTRLVPMPTEEAVREALRVDENPQRRIRRDWAVGRAMSLLEGESDD